MIRVIEIKALPDPELVTITYEQDLPNIEGYRKKQERVTGFDIGSIRYQCRIGDVYDHFYIRTVVQDFPFEFHKLNYDDLNVAYRVSQYNFWKENGKYYKNEFIEINDTAQALQFIKDTYYELESAAEGNNNGRNRYVTNATAHSIALYAMIYLNSKRYTAKEIYKLRNELSLENLSNHAFTKEELLLCFEKQSAYFLNLYKEMNENDRFEIQLNKLSPFEKTMMISQGYGSVEQIVERFKRRIFHKYTSDCENIHNDYHEGGIFHPNTKVFGIHRKDKYYVVTEDYLVQLGMRLCKNCQNIDSKRGIGFYVTDADNDLPF